MLLFCPSNVLGKQKQPSIFKFLLLEQYCSTRRRLVRVLILNQGLIQKVNKNLTLHNTLNGLGEMFKVDFADTCTKKVPLTSMGLSGV